MTMRGLALGCLVLLALVRPAAAWESACTAAIDGKCGDGPGSARERWIDTSAPFFDEHRQIWETTRALAGLPASVAEPFTLDVFTGFQSGGGEWMVDVGGAPLPSLYPVDFLDALRSQEREQRQIGEFTQLPDFSYSLWDWAAANESCPPEGDRTPVANAADCHGYLFHMGPVNSNHFLPQAQDWWRHYHGLALARAEECAAVAGRLGSARSRFVEFLEACEQQALVLEAVAHHFLQDAWSMGHMWERWGSTEPSDFTTGGTASAIVAATVGLIHGSRSLLQGTLPGDVNDAMCAPFPDVGWVGPGQPEFARGLGDEYLGQLMEDASYASQWSAFTQCAVSSMREVWDAFGNAPALGTATAAAAGTCCVDVDAVCFGQRATNQALLAGAALDWTTDGGLQQHLPLDGEIASTITAVVENVLDDTGTVALGPVLDPSGLWSQYRFDLANAVQQMRMWAAMDPHGTQAASGQLGLLAGVDSNGAYAGEVASYADPDLPWPGGADGDPRAAVLSRAFHRAHASDWCSEMDMDYLEALRGRVDEAAAADDLEAVNIATEVCTEFVERHVRPWSESLGGGERPLCEYASANPGSTALIDKLASGPYTAALGWCTCGDGRLEATEECDPSAPDGDEECPGSCVARGHTTDIDGTQVLDECTCPTDCHEDRSWALPVSQGNGNFSPLPPACSPALVSGIKDPSKAYSFPSNPDTFPQPSSTGCRPPNTSALTLSVHGVRRDSELNPGGTANDYSCDDVAVDVTIALGSIDFGVSGSHALETAWIKTSSLTGLLPNGELSLIFAVECDGATVHDRRFSYPYAWQVSPPEGASEVVCHIHFKDPYTEDRPALWQRLAVQGYGCARFNQSGCVGITAYAEVDVVLPKRDEVE